MWQNVNHSLARLKVLLGHLEVLPRARRLPDRRIHHAWCTQKRDGLESPKLGEVVQLEASSQRCQLSPPPTVHLSHGDQMQTALLLRKERVHHLTYYRMVSCSVLLIVWVARLRKSPPYNNSTTEVGKQFFKSSGSRSRSIPNDL